MPWRIYTPKMTVNGGMLCSFTREISVHPNSSITSTQAWLNLSIGNHSKVQKEPEFLIPFNDFIRPYNHCLCAYLRLLYKGSESGLLWWCICCNLTRNLNLALIHQMGRAPCCQKFGLKKGPWTAEEDQKLIAYIQEHGHGVWKSLPQKAGLLRCGKSCRLRWANYLRPGIKRGKFTVQEEQTIIQLHALLGNRWSAIAAHLPKRTDNEIKNYWNTHMKKRLLKMGIDPVTHKPTCELPSGVGGQASSVAFNLSHKAQWESARLEAEARLTRRPNSQAKAELSDIPWIGDPPGEMNSAYSCAASTSCLNLMRKVQNNWNSSNCQSIKIEMTSTLAPLEGALTQVNPTSSCLSLLQQAMCPSSKTFYNEVKKFIAQRRNPQANKSLECSDVSLHAKNSSNDRDLEVSDQTSPMLSTEVSSSTGFDSCATYDGFSTDMLLDMVENDNSLLPATSILKAEDQLCVQESKDYWSTILNFVNSSPNNNVQSIF